MKSFFWRYFKAFFLRPRLVGSILCGGLFYFLLDRLPGVLPETTRAILSWDVGIGIYLVLSFMMMKSSNHTHLADRAMAQVEGQGFILLLSVVTTSMSFFSIVMELATLRELQSHLKWVHVLIVLATIMFSWLFIHVTFSLQYAHSYYEKIFHKKPGGLIFPGPELPDYFDFIYFSFVIGTSGQTADVSFSSRDMRRLGTVHCVLSYFFNAAILALAINIGSSLL